MNNTDAIYRKIESCLRLSKSSNANEAATALKQAQYLMKHYKISETDILIAGIKENRIQTDLMRYKFTEIKLAATIAKIFNCGFYWINSTKKQFVFYGIDPNLTIAQYAYEVLLPLLKRSRKEYVYSLHGNYKLKNKRKLGDQFVLGWLDSVKSKCEILLPSQELEFQLKAYNNKISAKEHADRKSNYDSHKLYEAALKGQFEGSKVNLNHGLKSANLNAIEG